MASKKSTPKLGVAEQRAERAGAGGQPVHVLKCCRFCEKKFDQLAASRFHLFTVAPSLLGMSALPPRADMCSAKGMSALPPKADMCGALAHVR